MKELKERGFDSNEEIQTSFIDPILQDPLLQDSFEFLGQPSTPIRKKLRSNCFVILLYVRKISNSHDYFFFPKDAADNDETISMEK